MNKLREDELDAFLWEVETVSKQVKDILEGKIDLEKLEETEKAKKEKLEKEEKLKKMREEEEKRKIEESLRNGNKGKGEKDNYKKFCRGCFIEYEIDDIQKCTHCKYELISKDQRHAELKEKLEQLKEKKAKKMIRKQKYENWLKTEAILKTTKVNFQNYHKWDLYESSTDEDEKGEPILPRHDPNFLAMEKDLIETEKKREISRNKSIKLKEEGNKMMRDGKYKKAVKLYTEAIEETKTMMILYTNRALAYFKLEDYQNSIADCDKVIEYLEIFEDQLHLNKETYVKAISRKALCCQKMKNYDEAKSLLSKALEYVKDQEIVKLQKNLLLEEEVHLKALNLINGKSCEFQEITNFLEHLQKNSNSIETDNNSENSQINTNNSSNFESDSTSTFLKQVESIKILLTKDENNRLYFIQKGGLELILNKSILQKNISLIDVIEVFHRDRDQRYILVINNIKGYNKLISLLFNKSANTDSKNSDNKISGNYNHNYKYIKSLVSILEDSSHNEEVRKTLSDLREIDKLFRAALTQFDISDMNNTKDENVVIIIMHLFTFIGNLCYSAEEIRSKISEQYAIIVEKIYKFLEYFELNNLLHRNIIETVLSFLINLSCYEKFRLTFEQKESKMINFFIVLIMKELTGNKKYIEKFKNFDDLYERVCCLIYNLSFTTTNSYSLIEFCVENGIIEIIENYIDNIFNQEKNSFPNFNNLTEASLQRTLMLTAKITKLRSGSFDDKFYNSVISLTNLKFLKINSTIIDNSIKILAHYLQGDKLDKTFSKIDLKILCENLKEIFLFDYLNIDREKERVINNMSVMISVLSINPEYSTIFKEIVKNLILIAKEKMDLLRKNSAILLAKIAKSSTSMENYVRELHGMDVLLNIAKFLQINNNK